MYIKDEEFRSWLVEERFLNPEILSKENTKKEFGRFMEDYNTGTLPHEKYYNFRAYEHRMNALRAGETLPDQGTYDPEKDLADMRASRKKPEKDKESFLSVAELRELQKVERERTQIGKMKSMGLEVKPSMGVRMDTVPQSQFDEQ
ncbi:hypothetical protein DACRYDRAFT_85484 [Dacryopinax primogenitus]|uniref:Uncharacterized protein n=1 Tax=Dacryopinax primogenitus (strain DJM 731) TaxID=1858805 RepID=M5FQL3_DACPD|nr:uncharacterized protein DACRYDRAFT_85484 [Dacryopinax primogenitus]EJT97044.1 hypothetical protein DACRYDRAFT_85484 [Dacryopinax primogenitus]